MKVLSWDVGLRTLSYCVLEKSESVDWTIRLWDAIDVQLDDDVKAAEKATGTKTTAKRKKVTAVSVEYAAQLVMDTLHRRASIFDDVDAIIIEQQPAGGHNRHSNVRMKVVSHVIQCYFYTRSIVINKTAPTITFVSPASKLVDMERAPKKKAQEQSSETSAGPAAPKSQYTLNKKFAITKTQELLATVFSSEPDFGIFFNSSTVGKKDDLADSFLLGYYYILKQTKPKASRKRKEPVASDPVVSDPVVDTITTPEEKGVKKRGRKKKEESVEGQPIETKTTKPRKKKESDESTPRAKKQKQPLVGAENQ